MISLRLFLSFIFIFHVIFLFGQVRGNFGLTTGMTISSFQDDAFQTTVFVGVESFKLEGSAHNQSVYNLTSGILSSLSLKNFTLKVGINSLKIGSSRDINVKTSGGFALPTETDIQQDIRLEYLQIPTEPEVRFKIFRIYPFFSIGFSPSFYLNDYWFERSVNEIGEETQLESPFEQIEETSLNIFGEEISVNHYDYAFSFGGGFYLNPRISLGARFSKGKRKVFCPYSQTSDLIVQGNRCSPVTHTKTVVIRLQYRLFKEDLNDVIRFKKTK